MIVVPNGGEVLMLDAATGKVNATAWTLRLYTVITSMLSNGSVVADLTEALDGGYTPILLTAANWVATPGSPSNTAYPLQTFTFTGPLTTNPNVLGYYITNAAGDLMYAEALASPFIPTNNGDSLDVTLVLTLGSVTGD